MVKLLLSESMSLAKGVSSSLEIGGISPGIYLVILTSENHNAARKLYME